MTAESGNGQMIVGHEATLVSVILNGGQCPLELSDFSSPVHRLIVEAAWAVPNPELLSVQDELRRRGKLTAVGGERAMTELYNQSRSLGQASIDYALAQVLDASRARQEGEIGDALTKRTITGEEAGERLAKLGIERDPPPTSVDEFPRPMDEAAFYGLAGDVVRRIGPHTEADLSALLIQSITGFGSIIGRSAYLVADGSRHYLNLYGVLVGESSKSRKGTSWNRTAEVLQRVDEEWKQNCTANGLSSGEGLIWAVHDPISERKPIRKKGRHTGEYEVIEVDAGISDKRLCVMEGEFANVLKVITREGNTLSPVIRAAWETGDLRAMTKNSPARATGAHVSIIGHITRDELRRLLTQTESGNGFGNRFLWLAVKRSKCLPEGGQIESVSFSDLVVRLHSAVEFARKVGEVKRSEATRKLWYADYPELSEGKPGMLGAVTGRAEAQVMRLSAIYALLDNSALIQPVHHHAAMALWAYCERSAQWIFSTLTGDPRAERILAALQKAGALGLTRTEINERAFNGHMASPTLKDALRLLHKSGSAKFVREQTKGAPRERWVCTVTDHAH
ncbi:MAG: hypothetical protein M3R10_06090 [Verrucomicrobiota bacterium]|nr:hypothetical protein [Verrucomicrobiota bacterium]